jgi:hypothetical protein
MNVELEGPFLNSPYIYDNILRNSESLTSFTIVHSKHTNMIQQGGKGYK